MAGVVAGVVVGGVVGAASPLEPLPDEPPPAAEVGGVVGSAEPPAPVVVGAVAGGTVVEGVVPVAADDGE